MSAICATYTTERCFPSSDCELALSLDLIARVIAEDPASCNVSQVDAEDLTRLANAFHHALIRCHPATRTTLDTAAKNEARAEALARFRPVIKQIRDDPAVTDEKRINLNMRKLRKRYESSFPYKNDPWAAGGQGRTLGRTTGRAEA